MTMLKVEQGRLSIRLKRTMISHPRISSCSLASWSMQAQR
jgi:hypothetical protein